jgi:hypothetical protein
MPGINLNLHSGLAATIVAIGLLAALSGCSGGPMQALNEINPWVREQWQQDEKEITTYHKKVSDLAGLRSRATSMPASEREEIAIQLSERLKDEQSPVLRAELVRTLGEFPTAPAQQAVQSALSDQAVNVRIAACKALGRYPAAEGFEALSHSVTSDADLDVRIAAARELRNFRGFDAPKALRPALDDRDPALQLAAMQSLESLAGHTEYRRSAATWREYLDGGNPAPPPAPSIAELTRRYMSWY